MHAKLLNTKKIKDILHWDIKNDVNEFIQNEINQEEYQTLIGKRIIATFEKEIEFFKNH